MRSEPIGEIFFVAAGALAGAVAPAFGSASKLVEKTPITAVDAVTLFVAIVALAVSVVTGLLWWGRLKSAPTLTATIRNRPRVPVSIAS